MKNKNSQIKYLITQEIHKLEEFKEELNGNIHYSLSLNILVWLKLFDMIRSSVSNNFNDCEDLMILKNSLNDIYLEMFEFLSTENLELDLALKFTLCVNICKNIRDLI